MTRDLVGEFLRPKIVAEGIGNADRNKDYEDVNK